MKPLTKFVIFSALYGSLMLQTSLPAGEFNRPSNSMVGTEVSESKVPEEAQNNNGTTPSDGQPAAGPQKTFLMPGVIGLENGQWVGGDYLGHLSNNIVPEVEIIKGQAVKGISSNSALVAYASDLLSRGGLNPNPRPLNVLPLPAMHVLLVVYPIDNDKYVIYGTCRLFEHIQVLRNDWIPSGNWQGITWESLDVSLTRADQVDVSIRKLINTLVSRFIDRYQVYNQPAKANPMENGNPNG